MSSEKMHFPKWVIVIGCAILLGIAVMVGCRKNAVNKQDAVMAEAVMKADKLDTQMYEIGRDSNFVAQAAEEVEVTADLYLSGEVRPRRVTIKLHAGTWYVPETLYQISPFPGHGVECDDTVCRVVQ